MIMRQTKLDMARVIVQALYNMPELPAVDHHAIKKQARRKKIHLAEDYTLAHKILTDRVRAEHD